MFEVEERTRFSWKGLKKPALVVSLVFVTIVLLAAVFSPWLAPYNPNTTDLLAINQPPSRMHLLGTDELGRDVLSRVIFGARTSMVAAVEAVAISLLLGTPFGLLAGYFGGWLDSACSRVNDAIMSAPGLILALAVVAVLGPGLFNAMLAIGVIFAPRVFRVVRAAALEVRHETFIEVCESIGCSRLRVLRSHVLPHVLRPLLVVVTVSLGTAVLAEAGLSFLGLGVRPPTASWGVMIASAAQRLDLKWLIYAPGTALVLTIAAFTVISDSLGDAIGFRQRANYE